MKHFKYFLIGFLSLLFLLCFLVASFEAVAKLSSAGSVEWIILGVGVSVSYLLGRVIAPAEKAKGE